MRKRGQNEGTIYRRPNGTWCAQATTPDGKRLTKYAKTQRECRDWLAETLRRIGEGFNFEGAQALLSEYLEHWLDVIRTSVRPKTWEQYAQIARQHIIPDIGYIRLKDLRPDHIQQLYTRKLELGLGPRTVQLIHAVLHRSLGQALKWGLIPRNPTDAVEKPRTRRIEMQCLDQQQARRFLDAAQGSRYHALFHLAITTGLRQGELLGLQWSDVDLDLGQLRIQRQLQFIPKQGLNFTEPKTASSRRLIQLSPVDVEILRQHRKKQIEERLKSGGNWQNNDLVFPTSMGTPTYSRNLIREFKHVLKAAGLPDIRFHDLRHTAATLMLRAGVHPKVVQERLGHSSITLTLGTYSHVLPSLQDEAAKLVSNMLGYCDHTAT